MVITERTKLRDMPKILPIATLAGVDLMEKDEFPNSRVGDNVVCWNVPERIVRLQGRICNGL